MRNISNESNDYKTKNLQCQIRTDRIKTDQNTMGSNNF